MDGDPNSHPDAGATPTSKKHRSESEASARSSRAASAMRAAAPAGTARVHSAPDGAAGLRQPPSAPPDSVQSAPSEASGLGDFAARRAPSQDTTGSSPHATDGAQDGFHAEDFRHAVKKIIVRPAYKKLLKPTPESDDAADEQLHGVAHSIADRMLRKQADVPIRDTAVGALCGAFGDMPPTELTERVVAAYEKWMEGGLGALVAKRKLKPFRCNVVSPDGDYKAKLQLIGEEEQPWATRYISPPFVVETTQIAALGERLEKMSRPPPADDAAAGRRVPWKVPILHGESGGGKTLAAVVACMSLQNVTQRTTYCVMLTGHNITTAGWPPATDVRLLDEREKTERNDRSRKVLKRALMQLINEERFRKQNQECNIVVCIDEVGTAEYASFVRGLLGNSAAVRDDLCGLFVDCPTIALCIVGTGASGATHNPGSSDATYELIRIETDLLDALVKHPTKSLGALVHYLTSDKHKSSLTAAVRGLLKNARAAAAFFVGYWRSGSARTHPNVPDKMCLERSHILRTLMLHTALCFKELNALNERTAEQMMQLELQAVALHHNPRTALAIVDLKIRSVGGVDHPTLLDLVTTYGVLTDVAELRTPDQQWHALSSTRPPAAAGPGQRVLCVRNKEGRRYEVSQTHAVMLQALALMEPLGGVGDGFEFAMADFLWLLAALVQDAGGTRDLYVAERRGSVSDDRSRAAGACDDDGDENGGDDDGDSDGADGRGFVTTPVGFARRVAAVLAADRGSGAGARDAGGHDGNAEDNAPRMVHLRTKFEVGTCFDAAHDPAAAQLRLLSGQSAVVINGPCAESWDVLLAVRTTKKLHCWAVQCKAQVRLPTGGAVPAESPGDLLPADAAKGTARGFGKADLSEMKDKLLHGTAKLDPAEAKRRLEDFNTTLAALNSRGVPVPSELSGDDMEVDEKTCPEHLRALTKSGFETALAELLLPQADKNDCGVELHCLLFTSKPVTEEAATAASLGVVRVPDSDAMFPVPVVLETSQHAQTVATPVCPRTALAHEP